MKYRSNIPKYSEFVFENVDASFAKRAMTLKDGRKTQYHCGRSFLRPGIIARTCRHLPHVSGCPRGHRQIFERIHAANLINFGILPLTFSMKVTMTKSIRGMIWKLPMSGTAIAAGKNLIVQNKTKGTSFSVSCTLSARQKQIILAGGALNVRSQINK